MPKPSPSIQSVIATLTSLSADTGAELVYSIDVQSFMTCVVVFWDNPMGFGRGPEQDLPRELHLFFEIQDDPKGRFSFGCAYIPERYIWALDEGLDDTQAAEESRRWIDSIDEAKNYLMARPFQYIKKRQRAGAGVG